MLPLLAGLDGEMKSVTKSWRVNEQMNKGWKRDNPRK